MITNLLLLLWGGLSFTFGLILWLGERDLRRRRLYIPPNENQVVILDSAQIAKALREKRQ